MNNWKQYRVILWGCFPINKTDAIVIIMKCLILRVPTKKVYVYKFI